MSVLFEMDASASPPSRFRSLRELRRAAGLSLSRLAAQMNVSVATASRWETDRRRPHHDQLEALADVLGLPSAGDVLCLFDPGLPAHAQESIRPCFGLVRLRAARQLTRRALAAELGVAAATVAHWECGRRGLPARRIPELAHVLGVAPEELPHQLSMAAVPTPPSPLRMLRLRRRMTLQQVARECHVTVSCVSQWEREIRLPPWYQIRCLARVLNVDTRVVARAVDAPTPSLLDSRHWTVETMPDVLEAMRQWAGLTKAQLAT